MAAYAFEKKLNRATTPVMVIISDFVYVPQNSTHDSAGDEIFIAEVKKRQKYGIEVIEIDANMEDTVYFKAVVDESFQLFV